MDYLKLALELLASIRSIANAISQWLAKQAGRDAERAESLEAQAEGKRVADAAREQARADHAAKDDDSAFDQTFRRD
jgi:hypothetical protein